MLRLRFASFLLLAGIALSIPAEAQAPTGPVTMRLTYNVNPHLSWQPGARMFLYADSRRNPNVGQEDIFSAVQLPGTYKRNESYQFDYTANPVRVGEKIIVQGYMCAENTTDCYPSDKDNPPSCSVTVQILGGLRPSCQPVFTWTGGSRDGGVLCRAECVQ